MELLIINAETFCSSLMFLSRNPLLPSYTLFIMDCRLLLVMVCKFFSYSTQDAIYLCVSELLLALNRFCNLDIVCVRGTLLYTCITHLLAIILIIFYELIFYQILATTAYHTLKSSSKVFPCFELILKIPFAWAAKYICKVNHRSSHH